MPSEYRRKLPVPTHCVVCGRELPAPWFRPGPPRQVCPGSRCEAKRDWATRTKRAATVAVEGGRG